MVAVFMATSPEKDDKFLCIFHQWPYVSSCMKSKLGAPEAQRFYSFSNVELP